MKKVSGLILAVGVVAVLSGCGTAAATTTPPSATKTAAASTAPVAAAPVMSARGNFIETVGATVAVKTQVVQDATFSVSKIVIDPKCTGPVAAAPQNGHFIELMMTASVSPNAGADLAGGLAPGYGWTFIDAQGNTSAAGTATEEASVCLPEKDYIANNLKAGEKSAGAVIVDVTGASGTLVYSIMGKPAGWEYQVPQK